MSNELVFDWPPQGKEEGHLIMLRRVPVFSRSLRVDEDTRIIYVLACNRLLPFLIIQLLHYLLHYYRGCTKDNFRPYTHITGSF